ncbi:hypothetical protein R5R35_000045 [Gryllus longicercus]
MKLDTPEFKSIFTPELQVLGDLFQKHGFELRIAGGAVRDLLMNKTPHDLDFATTATPNEMKEMFTEENIRMINMQGEKHGTITPRINDKENFEVTTLRIDVLTDGRHAEVEFTTDWQLDANRRDLTINSMFLGLDGTVYDYFSGYDDLLNKKVVFVGDPNTRIQEDYLRILRYFRFYGRIAKDPNSHDAKTLEAIKNNAEGLQRISGERIWSELRKILEGNFAESLLKIMLELHIGPFIGLPENPNIEELTKVCSRKLEGLRGISVISALLKKPEEVMTFHARCKLSAFERDLALFLVEHREDKISDIAVRPYQRIVVSSKMKTSDIFEFVLEVLRYRGDQLLLEEFSEWKVPRFPVTGNQLKERGVPSGKTLGLVLQQLKEYWIEKDFTPTVEELLLQLPEVLSRLGIDVKTK